MTQNVIVAQRVSSEGNQSNWQVAVRVPSGKMFFCPSKHRQAAERARRTCSAAIKAMRYMFLLKARHGYEISKDCLRMLKEEHRLNKAALESAPMQEEGGVQPTVAPLYDLSYVRAVLCETAISVDEVFSEDFMLCVSISWGDWKHDHLCCRQLMQQLGYTFVREEVTEDDGSDAYSAVHYYK